MILTTLTNNNLTVGEITGLITLVTIIFGAILNLKLKVNTNSKDIEAVKENVEKFTDINKVFDKKLEKKADSTTVISLHEDVNYIRLQNDGIKKLLMEINLKNK